MLELAKNGDIPPEANQTAGQEAIALARRALEIHTQLHGLEHSDVADDMSLLADLLNYFNNVDDDEVLHLYEESIAIQARVEGSLSVNVAVGEEHLAIAYKNRAARARTVNDLDRELTNLELALLHYREAVRIYRSVNHLNSADQVEQSIVKVEEALRLCTIARIAAVATNS